MNQRLNRTAVVKRAAELADEIGFEQLTFTKLGRALGIAPPGVYRHVSDLDDLRRAISHNSARNVAVVLSSACAGLSGHQALSALAQALRDWAAMHPAQYAALQIAPDPNDTEGQEAAHELISVFASTLRSYQLEGNDLIDAIRLIRSTLHGFITLELSEGFKLERPIDLTFERIIIALDAMLKEITRSADSKTVSLKEWDSKNQ